MFFNYQTALAIVKHYQYLVGKTFGTQSSQHTIDFVIVVPGDNDLFRKFVSHFLAEKDNQLALSHSGYDPDAVKVILLNDDPYGNTQLYSELDSHLQKNNLEKIYDDKGILI